MGQKLWLERTIDFSFIWILYIITNKWLKHAIKRIGNI